MLVLHRGQSCHSQGRPQTLGSRQGLRFRSKARVFLVELLILSSASYRESRHLTTLVTLQQRLPLTSRPTAALCLAETLGLILGRVDSAEVIRGSPGDQRARSTVTLHSIGPSVYRFRDNRARSTDTPAREDDVSHEEAHRHASWRPFDRGGGVVSRVSNVNHCQRELDWRRDQPYARTHRARDTQNMYETRSEPHGTTADERVGLRSLPPPLLEQCSKSERARRAFERLGCRGGAPRGKGGRGRGSRSGVRGDAG